MARDPKNPLGLSPDKLKDATAKATEIIEQIEETRLDLEPHEEPRFLIAILKQIAVKLRGQYSQLTGADKEIVEMKLRQTEQDIAELERLLSGDGAAPG